MSAAPFPVQRHGWMQVPCEPAGDILVTFGDSQSIGHNPVMHSLTTEQLVLRPPEDSDFEVYKSFFPTGRRHDFTVVRFGLIRRGGSWPLISDTGNCVATACG